MQRIATNGHAYYAVTPGVEGAWRELLSRIGHGAGVAFDFLPPVARPQEELWAECNIGCVFMMCGYPIATRRLAVLPIAAPVPSAAWAQGRALYRSDLIVKADSRFQTLADTFGGRLGWTTTESNSGFNALRYHLLKFRTPDRPRLYSRVVGDLGSVRKLFDSVCEGTIDVGSVDSYWHLLLKRHQPELAARVRVIATTASAPIPSLVASPAVSPKIIERLSGGFTCARHQAWFQAPAASALIEGFAAVTMDAFNIIGARAQEAVAAGYPLPE